MRRRRVDYHSYKTNVSYRIVLVRINLKVYNTKIRFTQFEFSGKILNILSERCKQPRSLGLFLIWEGKRLWHRLVTRHPEYLGVRIC